MFFLVLFGIIYKNPKGTVLCCHINAHGVEKISQQKFYTPLTQYHLNSKKSIVICRKCGKLYKSSSITIIPYWILIIFIGIYFLIAFFASNINTIIQNGIVCITGIICIVLLLLYQIKFPYFRNIKKSQNKKIIIVFLCVIILYFVITVFLDINEHLIFYGLCSLFLMLCFALFLKIRYKLNLSKIHKNTKKISANSIITWYKHRENGLICPRLEVLCGEIFSVCFFNEKNVQISPSLPIMVDDLKWENTRTCNCKITLILDNISPKNFS